MLFMWGPGGANAVRMGDALVIVVGTLVRLPRLLLPRGGRLWDTLSGRARLPLDQGAALWVSFQASRAGISTSLDAHGHDSQAGSVWALR
jgi:hypothetical protein